MNALKKPTRYTTVVIIMVVLCAAVLFAVAGVKLIVSSSQENSKPLYLDGVTPAKNWPEKYTGEIVKITRPTTSKVVILAIKRSDRPGKEIDFAIGDDTMQIGDKVSMQMHWHVIHDHDHNKNIWLATKLGTNQVADAKRN